MADTNGDQSMDPLKAALAVKTARAIDEHLGHVRQMTRLALEDNLKDTEEFRNQVMQGHDESIQLMRQLIVQLSSMLDFVKTLAIPTETTFKIEEQPVTVNLPETRVTVRPNITVPEIALPEPKVIIDKPEQNYPKGAVIHHSDGTQSKVIFTEKAPR